MLPSATTKSKNKSQALYGDKSPPSFPQTGEKKAAFLSSARQALRGQVRASPGPRRPQRPALTLHHQLRGRGSGGAAPGQQRPQHGTELAGPAPGPEGRRQSQLAPHLPPEPAQLRGSRRSPLPLTATPACPRGTHGRRYLPAVAERHHPLRLHSGAAQPPVGHLRLLQPHTHSRPEAAGQRGAPGVPHGRRPHRPHRPPAAAAPGGGARRRLLPSVPEAETAAAAGTYRVPSPSPAAPSAARDRGGAVLRGVRL